MKVLRISHSGSVNTYRERERQLMKLGSIDLQLVIPTKWKHLGGSNEAVSETFPVLKCDTFGTGNIPLFAYDLFRIAQIIKKFQPDLIDIHEEPYSVSCFELVCLAKWVAPKAACVFYSAQNIKKKYPPPFCWMEKFVYQKSNGAYPCSEGVKDVLADKGFHKNVMTIPLGVDNSFFRPLAMNRTELGLNAPFVVGYFGRVEQYKGVDLLVNALARFSNRDWQLLIVGTGAYEESLRQTAQNLTIDKNIVLAGAVPMEQVPRYLNACDAVVIPSCTTPTWKEQFGRVATEAMACGVPVITSNSGSLPEVVGEAGIIVAEQNSSAIFEALQRLAEDQDYRRKLSEAGQARVASLYTWKNVAQMTLDLYTRALDDARMPTKSRDEK